MRADEHFWFTTLIRGFLALLTGSIIMVVSDMARTLLLLPVAMVVCILALAVYVVLDSVLVFITGYMARSRGAKTALRVQGVIGITLGILLYQVFFIQVRLQWFLFLIAIQALSTAIAEVIVAHHSQTPATSRWNLVAAGIAFGFSVAYSYILVTLSAHMDAHDITWIVFAYFVMFGVAESITAARMLFANYQLTLA